MNDIEKLEQEFARQRKTRTAIGDENRQHRIRIRMRRGKPNGVRVGEIAKLTNLSRPATSHHLGILKNAGIIKRRREGTKNYYYFDREAKALLELRDRLTYAADIRHSLPKPKKGESEDEHQGSH